MKLRNLIVVFSLLGVAACSPEADTAQQDARPPAADTPAGAQPDSASQDRGLEFGRVVTGGRLFRENCAACHGKQAEGDPNWQRRNAQGKFPPPPLNGTAHTWHHSREVLKGVIRNGTLAQGGGMPAWKEKLSDEEIDAIIDWIISRWPDEIYRTWREANPPK